MSGTPVIVYARRTPIGSVTGPLHKLREVDLLLPLLKDIQNQEKLSCDGVSDFMIGSALLDGKKGYEIVRDLLLMAELPMETNKSLVNRQELSGLEACHVVASKIQSGEKGLMICGAVDKVDPDQLSNLNQAASLEVIQNKPDECLPILLFAERLAREVDMDSQSMAEMILKSHELANRAMETDTYSQQVLPLKWQETIWTPKGLSSVESSLSSDELPRDDLNSELIQTEKAILGQGALLNKWSCAFSATGASAIVMVDEAEARERKLPILCRWRSSVRLGGSALTVRETAKRALSRLLESSGLEKNQLGLVRLSEDHVPLAMALRYDLELDAEKINLSGGMLAQGHPVGATSSLQLVMLTHELLGAGEQYGALLMPSKDGSVSAVLLETLSA